jgi:hypothetical protein
MRVPVILPVFVSILFASSFAFAHDVHVDYDHKVNFSKYKTFIWADKPETPDPLTADRIVDSVNAQLTARGLQLVSSGADLYVSASMSIQQVPVYNTYYDGGWGWGWGWGGTGWATTFVHTYLEGTTTVNLIDAASERTVWQGTATGGVSHNPARVAKKNSKVIADMFERYPLLLPRVS